MAVERASDVYVDSLEAARSEGKEHSISDYQYSQFTPECYLGCEEEWVLYFTGPLDVSRLQKKDRYPSVVF